MIDEIVPPKASKAEYGTYRGIVEVYFSKVNVPTNVHKIGSNEP